MTVLLLAGGWLASIVLLVWAWRTFLPRETERVVEAEERWLVANLTDDGLHVSLVSDDGIPKVDPSAPSAKSPWDH